MALYKGAIITNHLRNLRHLRDLFFVPQISQILGLIRYCQLLLQKLSNNGGVDAAEEQMKARQYAEPFKADKRKVIALAIELDDMGKGLVGWKEV